MTKSTNSYNDFLILEPLQEPKKTKRGGTQTTLKEKFGKGKKSNNTPTEKVIVVGSGGCGKTTYLKKLITGEFERKYIATIGVSVMKQIFKTSIGDVSIDFWDTAGQEKFGGLRDGYYISGKAAIGMYDLTSIESFNSLKATLRRVIDVCGNIPIIIIGTKSDVSERETFEFETEFKEEISFLHFEISVRDGNNIYKPIEALLRKLKKNEALTLITEK
ncbi:gtp-binding nuclear protein ran [Anaeramoeba flamelloides]|uniref:Gtp-binding nuclear protein ran n=1 Tax=Anaeramoeba flamelloides TaxID=1746091 RepID=A0ABQ8YD44_9EUKA|nr:gtp-binding nuclear protein ran [Anaeramoeba flamelloides]